MQIGNPADVLDLPEADLLEAATALEVAPVPTSGFVISITRRGKHRKLHAVAACRLIPGTHYREFVACGEVMPPSTDFESVCTKCLKHGALPPEEPVAESASDSDSSSTSSGSAPAP